MREEDNHGGITVGGMGMINRHYRRQEMINDVQQKGSDSKYHKWYQDYTFTNMMIHQQKLERYNKLPKWVKWLFKNPNKR